MSKEDIIAMARQSGFDTYKNETAGVEGYDCTEELERFAALVAAKEREACAQVCESRVTPGTGSVAILGGAADAIRAKEKP